MAIRNKKYIVRLDQEERDAILTGNCGPEHTLLQRLVVGVSG